MVRNVYEIPSNESVVMNDTILGGLLILRHNNTGNVGAVTFLYNTPFSSINVVAGISISRSTPGAPITISNTTGSMAVVVCKVIKP